MIHGPNVIDEARPFVRLRVAALIACSHAAISDDVQMLDAISVIKERGPAQRAAVEHARLQWETTQKRGEAILHIWTMCID